jgi:hypothetical protein
VAPCTITPHFLFDNVGPSVGSGVGPGVGPGVGGRVGIIVGPGVGQEWDQELFESVFHWGMQKEPAKGCYWSANWRYLLEQEKQSAYHP